jgi:hypothetical protein
MPLLPPGSRPRAGLFRRPLLLVIDFGFFAGALISGAALALGRLLGLR